MICTACNAPMIRGNGENREDFRCSNRDTCPAWDITYYPHLGVREGWWFCTQYHLPFKFQNEWYCVVGPKPKYEFEDVAQIVYVSEFQRLGLVKHFPNYPPQYQSRQQNLFRIPYMALPANNDFADQWKILRGRFEKLMLFMD